MRRPWWWRARRLDGVEAVSWRSSVFTRHRTDLPFPSCPTPRLLRGVR